MNSTSEEHVSEHKFLLITISVNIVLSVALNLSVLKVLRIQQKLEDAARLLYQFFFCFNLALNLLWSSWDLVHTSDVYTCKIGGRSLTYPAFTCLSTIMFSLCLISLEKYIFISRPLRYHRFVTLTRVKIVLLGVFLISCIITIPYVTVTDIIRYFRDWCDGVHLDHIHSTTDIFITFHVTSLIVIASVATTVVNVAMICIACRKSQPVDIVGNIEIRRSPSTLDGGVTVENIEPNLRNIQPNLRNIQPNNANRRYRRNRGVISILLITFSFYSAWIFWIFYDHLPEAIIKISGANLGWLQPLLYMITTKEARDIIKRKLQR